MKQGTDVCIGGSVLDPKHLPSGKPNLVSQLLAAHPELFSPAFDLLSDFDQLFAVKCACQHFSSLHFIHSMLQPDLHIASSNEGELKFVNRLTNDLLSKLSIS